MYLFKKMFSYFHARVSDLNVFFKVVNKQKNKRKRRNRLKTNEIFLSFEANSKNTPKC